MKYNHGYDEQHCIIVGHSWTGVQVIIHPDGFDVVFEDFCDHTVIKFGAGARRELMENMPPMRRDYIAVDYLEPAIEVLESRMGGYLGRFFGGETFAESAKRIGKINDKPK